MLISWRVPKTIQWIVKLFLIYLCIFTAFRIATVICFKPGSIPLADLLPSFWLGVKYDLRWIAIILLPIAVLSLLPRLSPFTSNRGKKLWTAYLGVTMAGIGGLLVYGADFGQFAYINARLNADALIFAEDPRESLQMVWQTYPVIWILIGLTGAVMMMIWMFRKMHVDVAEKNMNIHKFTYRRRWHAAALLLMGWFVYGFFTSKPLDFFKAFDLNDEFKSNLALNPMQNFFTTLRFRNPDHNSKANEYYNDMCSFLQLENNGGLKTKYSRLVHPGSRAFESLPNVVLVICESFSMYKSSMSGNPLNSTPYFNQMCNEGIFFERCFTPSFGTARGVFATITGIPDVQLSKFSTRNEESVNQRTIINDFDGSEKYFHRSGNGAGIISSIILKDWLPI